MWVSFTEEIKVLVVVSQAFLAVNIYHSYFYIVFGLRRKEAFSVNMFTLIREVCYLIMNLVDTLVSAVLALPHVR